MTTGQRATGSGEALRTIVGVVLFIFWGVLTVLWVYSIAHALGDGAAGPLIRGILAILLMLLLLVMEGMEVAVIDRWRELYPDRPASELAGWLAARQLFVALIVTSATILAEPAFVPVPFSSLEIPEGGPLKAFTIIWTTLTVLWFMQILPKHMAATNPDRYLRHTRSVFFPVVQVVHHLGIAKPAEMVAKAIERRLDWAAAEPADGGVDGQLESLPTRRGMTPANAWAALIPASGPAHRRPPDDRTPGPS